MARIRTIKPEFPHSESMGRISRDARLLFVQLWTICDDAGRTRAASRMLASLLFPYDDDAPALIDGWLAELEREGCLEFYAHNGSRYLQVVNWTSHQKIDRVSGAKCPDPREGSRGLARAREGSCKDLDRDLDRDREQDHDQNPTHNEQNAVRENPAPRTTPAARECENGSVVSIATASGTARQSRRIDDPPVVATTATPAPRSSLSVAGNAKSYSDPLRVIVDAWNTATGQRLAWGAKYIQPCERITAHGYDTGDIERAARAYIGSLSRGIPPSFTRFAGDIDRWLSVADASEGPILSDKTRGNFEAMANAIRRLEEGAA